MQVPISLQPNPELRRHLEQAGDPEGRVRRDGALAQNNLVQTVKRDPESARGFDLADALGFRNSSSSISPGGIAGPSQLGSLVIVLDPDFMGMPFLPSERHAVLVVDPHAVAAPLIALQPSSRLPAGIARSASRTETSSTFSFRWTPRQSARGIRLAARVLRSRKRSAVVSSAKDWITAASTYYTGSR